MSRDTTPTIARALLALLVGLGSCATGRPERAAYDTLVPAFADGQRIVDVATGRPIAAEEAVSRLLEARVIYIGEEAPIPWHREVAAQIVGELAARDPGLRVALAVVPASAQPLLDGWLDGAVDDATLSTAMRGSGSEIDVFAGLQPVLSLCRRAKVPILAVGPDPALMDAALRGEGAPPKRPDGWYDLVRHRVKAHGQASGPVAERQVAAWAVRAASVEHHVAAAKGRLVVIAEHVLVDRGLGVPLPVFAANRAPFRVVLPVTRGHLRRHDGSLGRLAFPDKRADLLWESPTDPHRRGGPAPDEANRGVLRRRLNS